MDAVVNGTLKTASSLATVLSNKLNDTPKKNVIVAFDGYTTADWSRTINLLSQQLSAKGVKLEKISFADVYKSEDEINEMIHPYLDWDKSKDPTLLFGRIFKGGYQALLDSQKVAKLCEYLEGAHAQNVEQGRVIVVFGNGCLISSMRKFYDLRCWFDVTPKESILRIRRGAYANLGDAVARPVNQVIRRCYYVDFELAVHLRGELLQNDILDFYLPSDHPDGVQLIPRESFNKICSSLAKYPFRCKPVYLEGVWGGTYVKKLRNLPDAMRNCAWVFDLIPMEVSIVVEAEGKQVELPFFTFVQREGESIMGRLCVDKFGGYFPIRFNYDDSYHSTGNMSIQVHSGYEYNKNNFDELGRQDESYYVVVSGHHAKTFIGFRDDADIDQFIKEIKIADTQYKPVDYLKYISYEESKPGLQVMIPAGTVHSSGRNQVVLEIGSLTVGSYTYKLYDYLRPDFDGKPRPIHTWHGERNLVRERRTSWVRKNIVQQPQEVRKGNGWAEYIVGEHNLLYFTLRRLEFEKSIEDNTNGKFHVLTLVDGEKIRIRSIDKPELYFDAEYMDMVVVPADMGRYVVENLGVEPICVHKTMLKDGFDKE
jgi:mannose-6-phosphate isomerase class I